MTEIFKKLNRICCETQGLTSPEKALRFNEFRNEPISISHTRHLLVKSGMRSYSARKKPILTKASIKKRFRFAKQFINYTEEDWRQFIFSDEAYFEINLNTIMNRVRRFRCTDPFASKFVKKTCKHPLKVMVWGCFSYYGVGEIIICDGNMNTEKYIETLQNHLLPSIRNLGIDNPYHLDDSAPCRRSLIVKNWHRQIEIRKIDWPGNSPDMNPIENLWAIIKYKLKRKKILNKQNLVREIENIWNNEISLECCQSLSNSMVSRIASLKKSKGKSTKY